ncbi:MAG: hypothetical protein HY332_07555 [Chloroflexi bacterium]|nr:hypothetical protein [Chloroflexota bacterium]
MLGRRGCFAPSTPRLLQTLLLAVGEVDDLDGAPARGGRSRESRPITVSGKPYPAS